MPIFLPSFCQREVFFLDLEYRFLKTVGKIELGGWRGEKRGKNSSSSLLLAGRNPFSPHFFWQTNHFEARKAKERRWRQNSLLFSESCSPFLLQPPPPARGRPKENVLPKQFFHLKKQTWSQHRFQKDNIVGFIDTCGVAVEVGLVPYFELPTIERILKRNTCALKKSFPDLLAFPFLPSGKATSFADKNDFEIRPLCNLCRLDRRIKRRKAVDFYISRWRFRPCRFPLVLYRYALLSSQKFFTHFQ